MTRGLRIAIVAACLVLQGCQREFVAPPDGADAALWADAPERFQGGAMPVFYITDRAPEGEDDRGPRYGFERSGDLRYGSALVSLAPPVSWEELTERPAAAARPVRVVAVREEGRVGELNRLLAPRDGRLVLPAESLEAHLAERRAMGSALDPWLDAGATEAIVFVHGFKNTFDDAAIRTAELWHYTGRTMIPIAYSWPAGSGGGLLGYTRDRESSEFTVGHLKSVLRALAAEERIEAIHLVAHSRGTDVAARAVTELYFQLLSDEQRSAGASLEEPLKLRTLVLAAPDMDIEVVAQRFFAEGAAMAPGRFVVYTSTRDSAIGLADALFRSRRRLGRLGAADISPESARNLAALPSMEMISCDAHRSGSSHSYVFDDPQVLGDLVALLRLDAEPGSADRPLLVREPSGMWRLDPARPPR